MVIIIIYIYISCVFITLDLYSKSVGAFWFRQHKPTVTTYNFFFLIFHIMIETQFYQKIYRIGIIYGKSTAISLLKFQLTLIVSVWKSAIGCSKRSNYNINYTFEIRLDCLVNNAKWILFLSRSKKRCKKYISWLNDIWHQ